MKKTVSLILAILMLVIAFSACAPTTAPVAAATESAVPAEKTEPVATQPSSEKKPFKVAVVLGVGGLGDGSYNDNIWEGFVRAQNELGVEVQCVEPMELSETMTHHMELAKSGEYDVIFGVSVECEEAVIAAATAYPEQQFVIINDKLEGYDNIVAFDVSSPETVFPMGVLAGLVTKTNKIGLVIGMESQLMSDECNAPFIAGAKYANPDCEVLIKYVGGWADSTTGKELTLTLVQEGCDVIMPYAGGSGMGVFAAAEEADFWAIGAGSNLNSLAPTKTIASCVFYYGNLVMDYIKMAMEGNLPTEVVVAGLKEKGVGYTFDGSEANLDPAIVSELDAICQKVIDGTIVVPKTWDSLDATIAANAAN